MKIKLSLIALTIATTQLSAWGMDSNDSSTEWISDHEEETLRKEIQINEVPRKKTQEEDIQKPKSQQRKTQKNEAPKSQILQTKVSHNKSGSVEWISDHRKEPLQKSRQNQTELQVSTKEETPRAPKQNQEGKDVPCADNSNNLNRARVFCDELRDWTKSWYELKNLVGAYDATPSEQNTKRNKNDFDCAMEALDKLQIECEKHDVLVQQYKVSCGTRTGNVPETNQNQVGLRAVTAKKTNILEEQVAELQKAVDALSDLPKKYETAMQNCLDLSRDVNTMVLLEEQSSTRADREEEEKNKLKAQLEEETKKREALEKFARDLQQQLTEEKNKRKILEAQLNRQMQQNQPISGATSSSAKPQTAQQPSQLPSAKPQQPPKKQHKAKK